MLKPERPPTEFVDTVDMWSAPLTPDDPLLDIEYVEVPGGPPMLAVVVDTEEEFDWSAPFSRANTSVKAIRSIGRVQSILAEYQIKPTYVVDFPVASQREGYEPLREIRASGEAAIGAHLHPWVTPPFVEQVSARNSFACNLEPELEAAKLGALVVEIEENFSCTPRVYKAGRYGLGRSTVTALQHSSIDIDVSIIPHMDFRTDGGPSFESFDARPFWFGTTKRLLEIPCTVGYVGAAGRVGGHLHRLASRARLESLHLVGVLARLRIADKLMLSPEGFTAAELRRLTMTAVGRGLRTFVLSFHSPSVEPGHTPYVQSTNDLERFLGCIQDYCDFFFGALGGRPTTPDELYLTAIPRRVVMKAPTQPIGMSS